MRSLKILCIDDESSLLAQYKAVLRPGGHTVVTAQGADEGVDLAVKADIDLLFVDFNLPHVSGLDVARLVKTVKPGVKAVLVADPSLGAVDGRAFVDGLISKGPTLEANLLDMARRVAEGGLARIE
jgi:CheY-like chemotaxis protein